MSGSTHDSQYSSEKSINAPIRSQVHSRSFEAEAPEATFETQPNPFRSRPFAASTPPPPAGSEVASAIALDLTKINLTTFPDSSPGVQLKSVPASGASPQPGEKGTSSQSLAGLNHSWGGDGRDFRFSPFEVLTEAATPIRRDDTTSASISKSTDTGNKYTQELVLNKTQAKITMYLGVNWVKKGTWASDAAYKTFIRKVKTSAYSYMDNKFKVVCTPKAKGAGDKPIELPIDFIIYDIDSGYTIEAHGGTPGGDSAMTQGGGKVFEFDSSNAAELPITYAHEFGHCMLGASDEYANPAVPGRVLTNDHSIMANYYAQGIPQAEFKARHFQHIVTEVAKAFAGYNCGIRKI